MVPGKLGDDRRLAPRQRVQQARLAGIGRADNGDAIAVADPLAAMGVVQVRAHIGGQRRQDRPGPPRQRARQVLVGKIDLGFDQRRRFDQPGAPALIERAERALGLAQRLAALALGLGVHQIGQALGFGQVELAVLEGAAGELARLGGRARRRLCKASLDHRGDHRRPAMDVQFGHILAGEARRTRETKAPGRRSSSSPAGRDRESAPASPGAAAANRARSALAAPRPPAARTSRITATPARPAPDAKATIVPGFM